jgi:hypothetical protein
MCEGDTNEESNPNFFCAFYLHIKGSVIVKVH